MPPAVVTDQQPGIRVTAVTPPDGQETQSATANPHDQAGTTGWQLEDSLASAVEELNRSMQAWSTQLRFEANREDHRIVVHVIDADSGEVIKTIPAESVLKAAELIASQDASAEGIQAEA
ncbi:MAG: flagellar protein FlaG [Comamonas sp.]